MKRWMKEIVIAVFLGIWTFTVAIYAYNFGEVENGGYSNYDSDTLVFFMWIIILVGPIILSAIISWFYTITSEPRLEKTPPKLPYPKLPYPKFPLVIEKPVEVEKIVEKIIEKPVPSEQGNIVINIDGKKITMNDSVYTE